MSAMTDIPVRGRRRGTLLGSLLLVLAFALAGTACQPVSTGDSSDPRNLFSGVADGSSFSNSGLVALKDSTDIFLLVGNLPNSGGILAAFNGRTTTEYPIASTGALPSLSNYLDGLIAADSFFIDTVVLQQIFSDSAILLTPGSSFIFISRGEEAWFSRRGNITLSIFDPTINRIYGTIEAEYSNALSGPRYINAIFEDVFFFDCATLEDCVF